MVTNVKMSELYREGNAAPYEGLPAAADGSEVVAWVETHISQGACAYPITPSTPMGERYQAEVAKGQRNLWGEKLFFLEPESEHSSASACEGFALAGGRVTNFNRHSKARGYHIKAEQHKVLALNPVTGESELMWEIKIVGAAATVNTPEKEEP